MEVTPPKIIEEGEVPTIQTSPSTKKNVLIGALAGLVLFRRCYYPSHIDG